MTTSESLSSSEADLYIGLDGLPYPVGIETACFPSADIEPETGEVDSDIKKLIIIGHYRYHLNYWINQIAGRPFSETTITEHKTHYEDLIADIQKADPSDPKERTRIETEFRRIDSENKDRQVA